VCSAPTWGPLRGRLKVTMVCAENLINLSYQRSKLAASNPYCMVFLYPNSPPLGGTLCPSVWRTPEVKSSLCPRWNATCSWDYCWLPPAFDRNKFSGPLQDWEDYQKSTSQCKDDEVLDALRAFSEDLSSLRDEVRSVSSRIFQNLESPT